MADIHLVKKGYYLAPADSDALEKIKKLSNSVLKCTITKKRNYQFHKKFFALIKLGHDNTRLEMPYDVYRKYCIAKAGFCTVYHTANGKAWVEADSISFDSKTEEEFANIYTLVLQVISNDIGSTSKEIEENLINFM